MKFYETSVEVKASPKTIWGIITDAPGFSAWPSGVVRVEGRIAPGEKIKVVSEANPKRTFAVKVTEFTPPSRMVWSGGMPLGLFKGVRTFTLTPQGDGSTKVHIREEYTGAMLGMIWRSMPDLQPSFDKLATGLKAKAESAT